MPNARPELKWSALALSDLMAVFDYISDDNRDAALALLEILQTRVENLTEYPRQGRIGRVKGTRELFIRPNYVVVYSETPAAVIILRVLHAAQQWP